MPSATQQIVPPLDGTTASGGGLFSKKRSHDDYVSTGPARDHDHSRNDDRTSVAASARPIHLSEKRARVDESRCRTSPTRSPSQHERVLLSTLARENQPVSTATTTTTKAPSSSLTTPCHVCQRRPRRKCDLDSFSDCEGCGERTCFVCLRECLGLWERRQQQLQPLPESGEDRDIHDGCGYDRALGGETPSDGSITPIDEEHSRLWYRDDENTPLAAVADGGLLRGNSHDQEQQPWGSAPQTRGHRRKVCSQCCVERGAEGAVVCLGCLDHAGSG